MYLKIFGIVISSDDWKGEYYRVMEECRKTLGMYNYPGRPLSYSINEVLKTIYATSVNENSKRNSELEKKICVLYHDIETKDEKIKKLDDACSYLTNKADVRKKIIAELKEQCDKLQTCLSCKEEEVVELKDTVRRLEAELEKKNQPMLNFSSDELEQMSILELKNFCKNLRDDNLAMKSVCDKYNEFRKR